MSKEKKDLHLSLMDFVQAYGHHSLSEFFESEKWNDFLRVLQEHIEDARDMLEIETDWDNIRYAQGQVNALRTIVDLADISVDIGKQLSAGMPTDELKEEDNERGIEPESVI